jgi:hypothetical protein
MMRDVVRPAEAMRTLLLCLLCASAGSSPVLPQQTKTPPHIHREGDALEKLNYFVGSWVLKATVPPGPMSEGGEFEQTQTVQWMEGQHFLISNTHTTGALGESFNLAVTGFSFKDKKFDYRSFHSNGVVEHGTGIVDGKTWTWISEPPTMDERLQRRVTLTELSTDKYSYLLEVSPDGRNWAKVMQGGAEKQH